MKGDDGYVASMIRMLLSDPAIKQAVLNKFYLDASDELIFHINIHDEFEYIFTQADRFQNIHIDIPPKYLSFVFYIPETDDFSEEDEKQNATILYDRDLKPKYGARFKSNSVCIFTPHFASYHGFSSSKPRDVLVMFYVNPPELTRWLDLPEDAKNKPPYTGLLDTIAAKLRRHPLKEFGKDEDLLKAEREACRINAPDGRVMVD